MDQAPGPETPSETEAEDQPQEEEVADAEPVEMPDVNLLLDLEETARAATVNASEHRLLQQIGRAANQGLLDVVGDDPDGDGNRHLELLGRSDRPTNPLDNISVTSAIDRETGLIAQISGASQPDDHCMANSRLAIHTWGNDTPFADQIGPLRGALVREFDDVNPPVFRPWPSCTSILVLAPKARGMLSMFARGRAQL